MEKCNKRILLEKLNGWMQGVTCPAGISGGTTLIDDRSNTSFVSFTDACYCT